MNRRAEEEKRNNELQELAERSLHALPVGHYRKEAAASDNSTPQQAAQIIRDLQQRNYGTAERHTQVLLGRLMDDRAQDRKAKARPAEITPDALEIAFDKAIQKQPKAQPDGFKLGAFERQIKESIANLEKTDTELALYDYLMGMKNAYRYALAIYKRTH